MTAIHPKRIMILAPHTDDGELGCGAAISKYLEHGSEVFYTAFSVCEQAVPYGFRQDELEHELMAATSVLGIPAQNVIVHRFEVRRFLEVRQKILQSIIDTKNDIKPDLVFMPCQDDLHQDHQVIAAEGLRAYKSNTIFSYELPWNNLIFRASAFVHLEERHVKAKASALLCYRTQSFRAYASEEFLFSLARTRGVQIGCRFAEAYELVRLVV